jgi:catechol 2,3-dioxygenase-like lactoylglutathione lyase family enzyme
LGASHAPLVTAVDSIGLTVSDLDRSIAFYSKVLSFEKVSEIEVEGPEYEHLQGVFGLRMRMARLRLGDEFIELTEYLAPKGRPTPADMRANDRWFQHIAIITSDMDRAYARLRQHKVQHASSGPQRLPDWNRNAGAVFRLSTFAIRMDTFSKFSRFRRIKVILSGIVRVPGRAAICSWE